MWLTATAKVMKQSSNCKALFIFDCNDAISFCQALFQFPEQYSDINSLGLPKPLCFDAIYTSNLLDHFIEASALILVTTTLLKPDGTLFTTSFQYARNNTTSNDFVKSMFGFPPELLPVVLGIRCIGYDGQYSSSVGPQPIPPHADFTTSLRPARVSLVWKNIVSQPITITSLTEESQLKKNLFNSYVSNRLQNFTFDSFLAIVNRFKANVHITTPPSHQFWEPLCKQIMEEPTSKPHLIHLQTQALLHGFHMHITVSEADCPVCIGQPLNDYIGGCTICFDAFCTDVYEEQLFSVHLESGPTDCVVLKSAGSSNGPNVQLDIFFPKECAKTFQRFSVYKTVCGTGITGYKLIITGRLQDVTSCSPSKYAFMKHEETPPSAPGNSLMGEIVTHKGDDTRFETTVSITDQCIAALEKTALRVERNEVQRLQILCGPNFQMTITYPYPIQSNAHVKLSKKNKSIVIATERAISCCYKEEPALYVDPNNVLALPQIHYEDNRLTFHFLLQFSHTNHDTAEISNMKCTFFSLAKYTVAEHTAFQISSEKDPGVCGIIIVHSVHFDPYFQSPAMYISFCLTHILRKPSPLDILSILELSENVHQISLRDDDDEYEIINKALTYIANVTRADPNVCVPPAMANHKCWQYFQQALIYPLYPNAQSSLVELGLTPRPSKSKNSSSTSGMQSCAVSPDVEQHHENKCTYCEQVSANSKKCIHCGKVQYCGKECQTKHLKEHAKVCKSSSNAMASAIDSCARCEKKTNLLRCLCQSVAYCSKECQKLDWPSHKESCTRTRKATLKPAPSSIAHQNQSQPLIQDTASMHKSGKYSNCNKATFQQLKRCSCHKAAYCSIECQRLNWPLHKDMCTSIKK